MELQLKAPGRRGRMSWQEANALAKRVIGSRGFAVKDLQGRFCVVELVDALTAKTYGTSFTSFDEAFRDAGIFDTTEERERHHEEITES